MSQENKNAPDQGAFSAQRRAAVDTQNLTTEAPPLSSDSLFKISCLVSDLTDFYLALCWQMIDRGSLGFNRIFSQLVACVETQDHLLRMLKEAADNG